jgi:hypothetical protein
VDAEFSLENVEHGFHSLLPSLDVYRMRPANNYLMVSFRDAVDFLAVVRAASGANVSVEIGWLFDSNSPKASTINACFLKLHLANECVDDRLCFLLDEIKRDRKGL